jgi:hypothetical protein
MTLTYVARELGLANDKAVYVARRRHKIRVEAGSDEELFPERVGIDRRGGDEFLLKDVRVWLQGHTRTNNPKIRRGKK